MPIQLNRKRLDEIVRVLGDRLDGDWVLVGGALAAIWLEPRRVTEDIDIISLSGGSGGRLELMEVAEDLGLPIEAVNSAADFFLERIPGWRDQLEVLLKGSRATIYRPDPTLFLMLKARRLSEQDLSDCMAMIHKAEEESLSLDRPVLLEFLADLPTTEDEELLGRRIALQARIE
jgi:hypothetical protein